MDSIAKIPPKWPQEITEGQQTIKWEDAAFEVEECSIESDEEAVNAPIREREREEIQNLQQQNRCIVQ